MNGVMPSQADELHDWIAHIKRCVKSTWFRHMTTLCELEDLTQEVLTEFIQIWSEFDPAKCPRSAWIGLKARRICWDLVREGIVRNSVVRVPRRGKKTKTINIVPERAKVDPTLTQLEAEEELFQTATELGQQDLTEPERNFLRLVYAQDHTFAEASAAIGKNRLWGYTGVFYRIEHGHKKPKWKKIKAAQNTHN
jgi:DNA-directed RNA polymerase specialized sigma24 family protein